MQLRLSVVSLILAVPVIMFWLWNRDSPLAQAYNPEVSSSSSAETVVYVDLIIDEHEPRLLKTVSRKVEDILTEHEVDSTGAVVIPPLSSTIFEEAPQIFIDFPVAYRLLVDGESREGQSFSQTLAGVLDEESVILGETDFLTPEPGTNLTEGIEIVVTRVRTGEMTRQETIGHGVVYRDDGSIIRGTQQTVQQGQDGLKELTFEQVFHNDALVAENLLREDIISQPVSTIIRRGTADPPANYTQTGTATWYRSPTEDRYQYVAASHTFPRGTLVTVTSKQTEVSIVVLITDFGPTPGTDRIIDLDDDAFEALGLWLGQGVAPVTVRGNI